MTIQDFYNTIMQRVLAEVNEIEYFEWYNAQADNENDELNYNLPAVFMEIEPPQWNSLGNMRQECVLNFNLQLETETLSETSNLEDTNERTAGLQHLDILAKLYKALHGYSGNGFGTISRVGNQLDNNFGQVKVTIAQFKVRIVDDFAQPSTEIVLPNPVLEITRVIEA